MEALLIGIVSAFNLLIIKMKLTRKRYEDAVFDVALMALLGYMFSGSYQGMVVAMVASLFISISFFVSPPTFIRQITAKFKEDFGSDDNIFKL